MDTMTAYFRAQAASKRGDKVRVFDWIAAANIIKHQKPQHVYAGLAGDWENTSDVIWTAENGIPTSRGDTYLSSVWAAPEICIDGEFEECWIYEDESPGWEAQTFWPDEARHIIEETTP